MEQNFPKLLFQHSNIVLTCRYFDDRDNSVARAIYFFQIMNEILRNILKPLSLCDFLNYYPMSSSQVFSFYGE